MLSSVIATFKEAGVHGRLRQLVEAESLFNDSTAAVAFGIAIAIASGSEITPVGIAQSLVVTIVGGIACGAAVAGGVLLLAGRTEDPLVEITFTTIATYGSFFLAEHLHVSGVLATLTAGIEHQHILFWGGLRGALALALALGLPPELPDRSQIVTVSFAVVAFSIFVQGLTITPLLRRLGEIAPDRTA